jgi:DNA-binding HxlR family transcriptional regulator
LLARAEIREAAYCVAELQRGENTADVAKKLRELARPGIGAQQVGEENGEPRVLYELTAQGQPRSE